eukprot:219049_1
MEKMVWDKSLSWIALRSIETVCKKNRNLTQHELSALYQQNDDLCSRKNGTQWMISYLVVYLRWMNARDTLNTDCQCDGSRDDFRQCQNCLQLIWPKRDILDAMSIFVI